MSDKEVESLNICSVIDYPSESADKVKVICEKALEIVNGYKQIGFVKFSYQFQEEYKKARFIIMGEIECVQRILDIFATIKL